MNQLAFSFLDPDPIERCLTHLQPGDTLGFICADRWMKNKYGAPLRALVAGQYHLTCYVDMMDMPALDSEVSAYSAITIIKREKPGPTRIAPGSTTTLWRNWPKPCAPSPLPMAARLWKLPMSSGAANPPPNRC